MKSPHCSQLSDFSLWIAAQSAHLELAAGLQGTCHCASLLPRCADHSGSQLPYNFETTYTFSAYTNLGTDRFPTKMARAAFTVPTNHLVAPMLLSTGMVTVVSVKIPTQLPDSTFRLDESKALHVWNTGESKGYGVGLILGEAGSNIVVITQ